MVTPALLQRKTTAPLDKKVQNKGAGRKVGYHGCPVLLKEKNELRLRIIGESRTALQVLRERLNGHKDVDYANYFLATPNSTNPNSTFAPPPRPVWRRF